MIEVASFNNLLIKNIYKKNKDKILCISPILPNRFKVQQFVPLFIPDEIYFTYKRKMANILFSDSYFNLSEAEFNKQRSEAEVEYINAYKEQVLSKLDIDAINRQLNNKVLVCCDCFDTNLCHRFLIKEWFNSNNYICNDF